MRSMHPTPVSVTDDQIRTTDNFIELRTFLEIIGSGAVLCSLLEGVPVGTQTIITDGPQMK